MLISFYIFVRAFSVATLFIRLSVCVPVYSSIISRREFFRIGGIFFLNVGNQVFFGGENSFRIPGISKSGTSRSLFFHIPSDFLNYFCGGEILKLKIKQKKIVPKTDFKHICFKLKKKALKPCQNVPMFWQNLTATATYTIKKWIYSLVINLIMQWNTVYYDKLENKWKNIKNMFTYLKTMITLIIYHRLWSSGCSKEWIIIHAKRWLKKIKYYFLVFIKT